jgi:hypothetical protein
LPERPPQIVKPDSADPIGDVIENFEEEPVAATGSIWPPPAAVPPAVAAPAPSKAASPPANAAQRNNVELPATKSGRLDR